MERLYQKNVRASSFFKGGSAAGELKEDIESKRMLLEREQEQQN